MQQRRTSRLEDGIDSTSQDSAQAGTSSTHTSVKQDMEDPKIHGNWQGSMAERMKHVRIMGLQPSPELLAISMGECLWRLRDAHITWCRRQGAVDLQPTAEHW